MSDSTSLIDQLSTNQANKELRINELIDALSPAALFGRRAATTTGLTWGYYGGRVRGTLVPNGTKSLTASSTNYLTVDRSTGLTLTASTSASAWNNDAEHKRAYKVTTTSVGVSSYEDHRETAGTSNAGLPIELQVACSDRTTALTTGTGKGFVPAPCAFDLAAVRARLSTASSSGTVTIDINVNGVSILSVKLTIDASEESSLTAAVAAVLASGGDYIPNDAAITFDIDGAGTGAAGLVVTLIGTRV